MRYKLVSAETMIEIEEKVNAMLSEGWLLFGGVAVSNWTSEDRDGYTNVFSEYCQAMTLEEKSHA